MTNINVLPAKTLSHEELQFFFSECLRLGCETRLLSETMYETANSKKAALAKPVRIVDKSERDRITQKLIPLRKFPFTIFESLWSEEIGYALYPDRGSTLRISSNRFGYHFVHGLTFEFPSVPEFRDYFDHFLTELRRQSPFDIVARENPAILGDPRKISIRDREWFSENADSARYSEIASLVYVKQ